MIAADTSTFIAYLKGDQGRDVERLDAAMGANLIVLPPVVLTELLSDGGLPALHRTMITTLPVLDVTEGYWLRAGAMRASILTRKLRARLADSLIAQSCIDHDVALISRDQDYRHFAQYSGLMLAAS